MPRNLAGIRRRSGPFQEDKPRPTANLANETFYVPTPQRLRKSLMPPAPMRFLLHVAVVAIGGAVVAFPIAGWTGVIAVVAGLYFLHRFSGVVQSLRKPTIRRGHSPRIRRP